MKTAKTVFVVFVVFVLYIAGGMAIMDLIRDVIHNPPARATR